MDDIKRRQFLHIGFAFSSVPLAACGGGSGTPAVAATVTPFASPAPAPAPVPAPPPGPAPAPPAPAPAPPPPPPAPTGSMAFVLSSSAAVTTAPFCLGFAFKKADVPAGQGVVGSIANLQVVPKNYWPDGSLKFAVVAGRADLAAGQALTVTLAPGASTGGTALALADLKATGITASVGCGSFGAVSWATTDWDAPFQSWVSGPQMSSWVYRKAVGTDAHLVAWLEVRLYAGGAVEVLPWIENGYLLVAGPTNKSAAYTFTLGAAQRFSQTIDLPHHCRTPLVSGTALSHWLGTEPAITPRHDAAYLQATELVPTYSGRVASPPPQQTSYAPLQQGGFAYSSDTMNSTGFASPIGLLPQHDVLYLTANIGAEIGSVVRNGFSAGRYGIHYRDPTTNRPLRFSAYPTLLIAAGAGVTDQGASTTNSYCPTPSGTTPPQWDGSHHPSVGFMAYLLTGRWYFMEEVQFAATLNYLNVTDSYRGGADGVFDEYRLQTRNTAWSVRTLAQALTVTPDTDPLRAEFLASFEANVSHMHARYIAQPNNPFGLLANVDYGSFSFMRSSQWMNDFNVGVWGYAKAMSLPISAAVSVKFDAFYAWHAGSIVGRLGTSSGFWYVNAAPYTIAYSPSKSPDWLGGTGPWYADWTALYAATQSMPNNVTSAVEGTLSSAGDGGAPNPTGYWGNLQPAIAYAVRHGVPGALAAYQRMTAATNWPALAAGFNLAPGWGVVSAK